MKPNERIDYRKQQLVELYEHYFANNLENKDVTEEIKADVELRSTYIYLNQKGLVNYDEKHAGQFVAGAYVKITAYGIDVAEEEIRRNLN